MAKRIYDDTEIAEIKLTEREAAIRSLEKQRADVNREIEELLRSYAKLSGRAALARRKYRVGEAPNDWKPR